MDPREVKAMIKAMMKGSLATNAAARLLSGGMNTNALRTNAVLRKDEWKQYDTAVIKAAQVRLVGVADVMARGLVYRINNGLGTTVLEYETESDVEAASVNMSGVTKGNNDTVEWDIAYMPLPIIHKDFQINIRKLNSSRTTGQSLDTVTAELSARKVAEKIEEALFTGLSTYTYGGGVIYGLMDEPNRNLGSLTANWDDSAASGTTILADILAMKQASIDDRHYGPWAVYVPTNFETPLDEDYVSGYPKTVRSRLQEIDGIEFVKVADKLTADNVIMVQMTSDVVRMVEGLPLTTVEWTSEGGMIFKFKVMTINIPQIRADQDLRSGVMHWS